MKAREIDAFEAGYIQGHDATVEGRYADPSDAAQDYVRTLLVPVDEANDPEMCPNCVTPWKCNGPHEFPAASSEAAKVDGIHTPATCRHPHCNCEHGCVADAALSTPEPQGCPLPPIDRDESYERDYIPLPGKWEIQTKGKGSTFRIADPNTGKRWPVLDEHLHPVLERMAREIRKSIGAAEMTDTKYVTVPREPTQAQLDAMLAAAEALLISPTKKSMGSKESAHEMNAATYRAALARKDTP